jgi:hypothetical protein
MFVECEIVPLVPAIFSVYVPELTPLLVVIFKVELPVLVSVDGVKLALACLGRPATLNDTVPVKVPLLPTVTA